jgi:hypothetical protein
MAIGVDASSAVTASGLRVALSDAASLLFAHDDALVASVRFEDPIDLRSDAAVLLRSWHLDGRRERVSSLERAGASEATQYPPGLTTLVAVQQWRAGTSEYVTVGQRLHRTSPSASPPTPSSPTWPGPGVSGWRRGGRFSRRSAF